MSMSHKLASAVLASAMAIFATTPSTADIINVSEEVVGPVAAVTWTGTVNSGFDNGGFFGPVGANLTGESFSLVYIFVPSLGIREEPFPGFVHFRGGLAWPGSTSPSLGAVLTINGQNKFIGENLVGVLGGPGPAFGCLS